MSHTFTWYDELNGLMSRDKDFNVLLINFRRLTRNKCGVVLILRYKNNFARMESDYLFKVGFRSFMKKRK